MCRRRRRRCRSTAHGSTPCSTSPRSGSRSSPCTSRRRSMLLATSAPTLSHLDVLVRLAVAAGLGAAVGFERELRDREAGIRTHLLVSLGSGLFTIVSAYGFEEFTKAGTTVDPTRIAAQIVTGIGFLGAGAIIREGLSVRGLTTAGSLWVSAAIGMAAGAGWYGAAVATTILTIFALWPLRIMAYRIIARIKPEDHRVVVELKDGTPVAPLLRDLHEGIRLLEISAQVDRRIVTLELRHIDEALGARLSELDYVIAVRWRRGSRPSAPETRTRSPSSLRSSRGGSSTCSTSNFRPR